MFQIKNRPTLTETIKTLESRADAVASVPPSHLVAKVVDVAVPPKNKFLYLD